MIRNLKVLGLALVAVFAFAAISASAASAQQAYLTSTGPVTLIGEENGAAPDFLETGGIKVTCPGSTYTGHKQLTLKETEEGKVHGLIPTHATVVTLTPHYKQTTITGTMNCHAVPGSFPATVFTNGCDYDLHLGSTSGTDVAPVTADVVCPAGKAVEVKVYTTEAEDPSTPFCTLSIGSQTGKTGASVTDKTNGTGQLSGTVTGLSVNRANHGAHTLLCPNTNGLTGTFKAEDLITGRNELGEATSIGLSHEGQSTSEI